MKWFLFLVSFYGAAFTIPKTLASEIKEEDPQRRAPSSSDSAGIDAPAIELPKDVILIFFRYLPTHDLIHSAGMTCTEWRKVSQKPDLWSAREIIYSGKGQLPKYVVEAPLKVHFKNPDDALKTFPVCPNITAIFLNGFDLQATPTTKQFLAQVNSLTSLTCLSLVNCGIDDRDEEIHMMWCEAFKKFAENDRLQELNLSSNQMGNRRGGYLLALYIKTTTSLRTLVLSNNKLDDLIFLDAFIEILKERKSKTCTSYHQLEELDLSYNYISSSEKIIELVNLLTSLKKLNLIEFDKFWLTKEAKEDSKIQLSTLFSTRLKKLDL
jgi:Leucine-rich repeat (LRR) protein